MRRQKLLAIVCLCLLPALAGCIGTMPVQVEVDLEDVSAVGEQVRFRRERITGRVGPFRDGA